MLTRLLSHTIQEGDCLIWIGNVTSKGYGKIKIRGQQRRAHRVSYELHYGPIPEGLHILHKCHRPACINPKHLYAGTNEQNIQDKLNSHKKKAHHLKTKVHLTSVQLREILESKNSISSLSDQYMVSHQRIERVKLNPQWVEEELIYEKIREESQLTSTKLLSKKYQISVSTVNRIKRGT